MRLIAVAWVLTLLTACGSRSPRPVDIESSDMCDSCRMAISQRQFAAEIVDGDGDAVKFDDIGCMLRFLAGTNRKAAAVFVVDYGTRQWTEAKTAYFVRGSKVRTPMAGGILAFSGRAQAEAAVREIGGQVLAYSELSKP